MDVDARTDLLHERDIGIIDIEYKILILIREEVLDDIKGGHIRTVADTDEQHHAADIVVKPHLAGLQIDVTGQDVVEDHVLDKVAAIILFIIILLDAGKRDRHQRGKAGGLLVGALHEHDILAVRAVAERLVGAGVQNKRLGRGEGFGGQRRHNLADAAQIAARDDGHSLVDHADGAVNRILHLMDDTLEESVRHS